MCSEIFYGRGESLRHGIHNFVLKFGQGSQSLVHVASKSHGIYCKYIYIFIYICICMYVCMYVCIYIYIYYYIQGMFANIFHGIDIS